MLFRSHHIQRLKKAKLIESIKQGRTVRYTLGEVGKMILNSNTEIISKAYVEHLFSRLKEECLTPEVVELDGSKLTIRVSCPGKDDVYLSIELKSWEFVIDADEADEDDSDEISDGDEDDDEEILNVVKDFSRRPKIVRVE